ncbi:UNVERIFIED_CONTAM: hypothetical protein FKN15_006636 [Acipenser sinensis]
MSSGSCRFSYSDPHIIVSYNRNGSEDWAPLEKIRAPTNSSTVIHLLHLSSESKGEAVRLRWHQEPLSGLESYESCWALDNILLINAAHRPVLLQDSLDPPDTANWLFFPGATVKHACQSEGNAMYFHGMEVAGFSFASTRDVDLSREEGQSTWWEGFESPPAGWEIWGAVYSSECGELESGSSLVFLRDGERKVCTPYLDTTVYGNLRLHFTMGEDCSLSICLCDPGFSGPACEMASQTYPAFILESFLTPRLSSYHNFQSIRGAEVSFGCGVLASGKSLVFNKDSRRHLVTSFLDSTQARYTTAPQQPLLDGQTNSSSCVV